MRIRTGYSFRSAVGHLEEVAARLEEANYPVLPMTDTSAFGWTRWKKIAEEAEMKPVFGLEIGVSESPQAKKPIVDRWTFIAKDDLAPLNRLFEMATRQFRYEPLLTYDQAINAEGIFKIVGHRSNLNEIDPGTEDLFIALSPSVSKGYFNLARSKDFQFIEASDNVFTNSGDMGFYQVVCGRGASPQSYPQYIMDRDEWFNYMLRICDGPALNSARENFEYVADNSTAELRKAEMFKPERPDTLRGLCRQGAVDLNVNLNDPVYSARFEKELALITEKGFEDYFFIIADVVQWARKNMCVGPARGSSCGSLVCYLLKITTVDPIPYNLIFERFIDINRSDLPDIDIDFSDRKRELVFKYMEEKFGADHVARLGSVSLYKPKSALNEASGALDIPPWKVTALSESLIERKEGDSRALKALEDTLTTTPAGRLVLEKFPEIEIAARMEGHPRHATQHAAGVVLTNHPVSYYLPIDAKNGAVQCDRKDAETLDLLKIDALGLTQLSIFEDTLERIGKPFDFLDKIPLNDKAAFDQLNRGKFSGIFQFAGQALQGITKDVTVTDFEDIVAITALARPGPLDAGGAAAWVKIKRGEAELEYPHPIFEPILKNTLGIITYQEQIMQIAREVGGLPWPDVIALRKAMGKTLGQEAMNKFGDPWKKGAIENGVDPVVVERVWDEMIKYGSYAFNRSHAVAYGMVSYYCCWLKAHYPLEFAASALSHAHLPEEQIGLLRELANEGFDYIPVDKETSTDRWEIKGKTLVGPATNVNGIGPKLMSQIMHSRQSGEPLPPRAEKLLDGAKTKIDSLYPITDRFLELMPDPRERNIHTRPIGINDIVLNGKFQEVLVFCTPASMRLKNENDEENVKRRGYKFTGPETALNLWLSDDTGTIFAKVDRFAFAKIGREIMDRGRAGKSLYAIKGKVPPDFPMIKIDLIRYIGDMENDGEIDQAETSFDETTN